MNDGNALKNFKYCAKLPQDAPNGSQLDSEVEFMSDQCSISASFIRTKCLIILIKMGNITNILSLHLFTIYDLGTISYC